VHWASLSVRPQCWHAKGACATPNKKERKERKKKERKKDTQRFRTKQVVYQMVKTYAD